MPPTFTPEEIAAEEWRPVPGFDGYEVSSLGRVRSWRPAGPRAAWRSEPVVLRPTPQNGGYGVVCLRQGCGPGRYCYVHRLVLMAFVGPCPDGMECAHANGQRHDARLVNLAWVTPTENQRHKHQHGTAGVGANGSGVRLSASEVELIRARCQNGESFTTIALAHGVNRTTVSRIARGKSWADSFSADQAADRARLARRVNR